MIMTLVIAFCLLCLVARHTEGAGNGRVGEHGCSPNRQGTCLFTLRRMGKEESLDDYFTLVSTE
jgi:hypothetical protein